MFRPGVAASSVRIPDARSLVATLLRFRVAEDRMKQEPTRERIARIKSLVPKGKVQIVALPPLKGETLSPISARDLGLGERKAA